MTTQALEALKLSIEHWRRMATGTASPGEAPGSDQCSLCKLFRKESSDGHITCDGCPVMERTGKPGCEDTPYELAQDEYDGDGQSEEFLAAAKMELDFLESLLPKT